MCKMGKGFDMGKILKNIKGMTLTEVIIALAVLGIISVPLIAVFSNSVLITQLTRNQLEVNAVVQIVKVEVTQAVKNGSLIKDFEEPSDISKAIDISPRSVGAESLYLEPGNETKFLHIDNSNLTGRYKYKVRYMDKAGATLDTLQPEPDTVELLIMLYSAGEKHLKDLKVDIHY